MPHRRPADLGKYASTGSSLVTECARGNPTQPRAHSRQRLRTTHTLLPPNPLLFFRMTSTFLEIVVLGKFKAGRSGSSSTKPALPGTMPSRRAMAQKPTSRAPDMERVWPVSPLVLLTKGDEGAEPNTRSITMASALSPTGVEVAWALM